MGEVLRDGDRIGLRYVRELAHPPERVWRGLTESDQLRYWMPCDIVGERRSGAAIELPFWPEQIAKYGLEQEPVLPGRIEVWEPPARFDWTWGGDRLSFRLTPTASGTRLEFTTWLADPDPAGAASAGGGYHTCLHELGELLTTGTALPLVEAEDQAKRWTEAYAEVIRRG